MSRKLTIEEVKLRCTKLGVEFLDDFYNNNSEIHNFKCACGNTFERNFNNVTQGQTNCSICSGITQWDIDSVQAWCKERKMEFLSDAYLNSSTKYHFKCACGNTFERTFSQVTQGSTNCSACSNRTQWDIDSVQAWCKERNIEFLSDTYYNANAKYHFKCACGNTFERTFSQVTQGLTNCLACSNMTRWDIDSVQVWCKERNIEFLSDTYYNANAKYHFKCACGNTFERQFRNVTQGSTNCSACSNRTQWDIDSVQAWCKERKMEFLSDTYLNSSTKYHFKCACGNTFERTFSQVTQGQTNCSACSNRTQWDIDSVQAWCKERNIEFLSDTYYNVNAKYHFKCACGNTFERTFNSVTQGQTNCSVCSNKISKGETKISDFLIEHHIPYEQEFSFVDLRGENDTSPLRFDFSITINDQLLLVEYDGIQHFEPIEYFGGEEALEQTKKRDQKKNDYCEENNIPLLRIPYGEFDRIEELLLEFIHKYSSH